MNSSSSSNSSSGWSSKESQVSGSKDSSLFLLHQVVVQTVTSGSSPAITHSSLGQQQVCVGMCILQCLLLCRLMGDQNVHVSYESDSSEDIDFFYTCSSLYPQGSDWPLLVGLAALLARSASLTAQELSSQLSCLLNEKCCMITQLFKICRYCYKFHMLS